MALEQAFDVTVNGSNNPVREVEVRGSRVTLEVTNRVRFGDTITVSYTVPATSRITDRFGNALEAFANQAVDNEIPDPSDTTPPEFDDASTDTEGREISISFDEDIIAAIPPNPVINLNELDAGPDPANENRYFIEWRWSPGRAGDDNAHEYYQYRIRRVTSPVTAWGPYIRTEQGSVRSDNLLPNSTYEINVVATNTGGDSTVATDTADTPVVESGQAPINFTVTDKGRRASGSNFVFFAAFSFARDAMDTAPLTRFEYRHKKSADSAWSGWVANGTDRTFEITTLERNTAYDFEVRMVNFIGVSDAAEISNETVTFNAPDAIENFVVVGSRTGEAGSYAYQLALSWDAVVQDDEKTVDSIRYRHKLDTAANYGAWVTVASTATSATITGLTHTVEYDVQIEAVNNVGSSTRGTVDDAVTLVKPGPVTMLDGIHTRVGPVASRSNNVTFSWTLPSGVIDDVQARTRVSTAAWGAFVSQGATAINVVIQSATDNTTYEIEVKVLNSAGESAVVSDSLEVQVLAAGPMGEVINLVASGNMQMTWHTLAAGTAFVECEYMIVGDPAWRAAGVKAVPDDFQEFDFIFFGVEAITNADVAAGRTVAGARGRARGLNASREPTTMWAELVGTDL